jgi:hypothetical protein
LFIGSRWQRRARGGCGAGGLSCGRGVGRPFGNTAEVVGWGRTRRPGVRTFGEAAETAAKARDVDPASVEKRRDARNPGHGT